MLAAHRLPSVHDLADSARHLSRRAPRPSWMSPPPPRVGWARGTAILGLGMLLGAGLVLLLESRPLSSRDERRETEPTRTGGDGARAM